MSMTAGDFDFDSIFRQDPAGESDDANDVPFIEISYILWIVFVILMPILLTNLLVCVYDVLQYYSNILPCSRLVLLLVISS